MTDKQEPQNNKSNDGLPSGLDDLERRIRAARGPDGKDGPDGGPPPPNEGVGQAMRVGAELISALIVGTGIGWLLDSWLETRPWLMLLFFFLGAAAGILNVYRSTGLMERGGVNLDNKGNKNGDNPPELKD